MSDNDAGNGGQQTGSPAGATGETQLTGSTGDNQAQQIQPGQQSQQGGQQGQQAWQGGQGNGSEGNDGNTGRPPAAEQTFTQADLDRIVGERLARQERTKYADYEDLKTKASELDTLKQSQLSDQEKAVETARIEAKAQAAAEFGAYKVDAEVRVATTGRLSDEQRTALLDGLDRSRFLTQAGEVDTEKVRTFVEAVAPAPPPPPPVTGGTRMGQGRQPASSGSTLLSGRERYEQKHKRTTT